MTHESSNDSEFFDVYAVNLKTGARRLLAHTLTEKSAEATVNMAIARRGVDEEYYVAEPQRTRK